MLECLLVVAMSINDHVMVRSLGYVRNVPEHRIEFSMAIEAGRHSAVNSSLIPSVQEYTAPYGYDCGQGWVDKGIAKREAFKS